MHILPNQMTPKTLRWYLGIEFSVGLLSTLSLTDVPSKRPGSVCRLGLYGYGTWGGSGDFSDRAGGRENDPTSCLKAVSAGCRGEQRGVQSTHSLMHWINLACREVWPMKGNSPGLWDPGLLLELGCCINKPAAYMLLSRMAPGLGVVLLAGVVGHRCCSGFPLHRGWDNSDSSSVSLS